MRRLPLAILGLLALTICTGCNETMADPLAYVPPDSSETASVDPFVLNPADDCDNPDCVCDKCACDPCQCGADNPEPQPQSSASMRPGYTLSLLSAGWFATCPAAKTAAYEASVPVELVDIEKDAPRAAELLGACPKHERSVPMWVLCLDNKPVKYWWGPSNAAGVEIMAAWEPSSQVESATGYNLKRGDPNETVVDNGLVLPDGTVILPSAEGYPEAYAPPYESRPHPQYHQWNRPNRVPVLRFFGGCSGGRCYSGGCANGRCG